MQQGLIGNETEGTCEYVVKSGHWACAAEDPYNTVASRDIFAVVNFMTERDLSIAL